MLLVSHDRMLCSHNVHTDDPWGVKSTVKTWQASQLASGFDYYGQPAAATAATPAAAGGASGTPSTAAAPATGDQK